MKSNRESYWKITLYGVAAPVAPRHSTIHMHGDIEAACVAADEHECEVDFEVQDIVIHRLAQKPEAAA